MSQFFTSCGQRIGVSVSASVLPTNIQGWFPFRWTGWISLGFSRVFSRTTVWKHQYFGAQASLWSNSHIHARLLETTALTRRTFVGNSMSLLFNMLSKFVMAFLKRSKHLLILWLQSWSKVILEPKKMKSVTVSTFPPSICYEVIGVDAMIFGFWILNFKPAFSLSSFTFIRKLFGSSLLSAIKVVSCAYLRLLIFVLAILILACKSSSLAFHLMHSAK